MAIVEQELIQEVHFEIVSQLISQNSEIRNFSFVLTNKIQALYHGFPCAVLSNDEHLLRTSIQKYDQQFRCEDKIFLSVLLFVFGDGIILLIPLFWTLSVMY